MDFFVGPSGHSITVREVGTYSLAKPLPFALYLASIIQPTSSPSPVLTTYYSVKFYLDLYGCLSPTESSLVVNILEGAKRQLAKYISKKCLLPLICSSPYNSACLCIEIFAIKK